MSDNTPKRFWLTDRQLAFWGFVVGVLGSAIAVWQVVKDHQSTQITYSVASDRIYNPEDYFSTSIVLPDGRTLGNRLLTNTRVTIWNSGNTAFKIDDVRIPLTIAGDSSVQIYAAKIILSKSIVKENFSMLLSENQIVLSWKIFDPDDAVRIAILHDGDGKTIYASGNYGPGKSIQKYPVSVGVHLVVVIVYFVLSIATAIRILNLLNNFIFQSDGLASLFRLLSILICIVGAFGIVGFYGNSALEQYLGDTSPIGTDIRRVRASDM